MERITRLDANLFLDGPAEYLVSAIVEKLKLVKQFKTIFGDEMDSYRRMDYSHRAPPALRVYNDGYNKQFESWFIEGDVTLDVILPASLRREETQRFPDRLTSALLQQFRRPGFFEAVEELVPGLNELGKTFTVDKSLAFEWGEQELPLTQITANFKLDLRQWDSYLERSSRTKEDPFERTLGDLETIFGTISGLNEAEQVKVTTELQLNPEE